MDLCLHRPPGSVLRPLAGRKAARWFGRVLILCIYGADAGTSGTGEGDGPYPPSLGFLGGSAFQVPIFSNQLSKQCPPFALSLWFNVFLKNASFHELAREVPIF